MLLDFQEKSGTTPRALATKPELPEHLVFYWQLFSELSEERSYSGIGEPRALSLHSFLLYASFYQFTRLEAQQSWEFVRKIDELWMEEHQNWRKKEAGKAPKLTTKPT